MLCLLGADRGKQTLADPLRDRPAAFGTAGAETSPYAGPAGVQRSGLCALHPRHRFADVEIDRETPDIIGSTPEEEAELACIMQPSGLLIDEKKPGDTTREEIMREMVEAFAAYSGGIEMLLPSTVFLVTARRPR